MVEFGDNLLNVSYKIPWLIWIQFFVMFLLTLIIFLSYFGFLALNHSSSPNADDSLISSSPSHLDPLSACFSTQVSGDHDPTEDAPAGTTSRAREVENIPQREGTSAKDLGPAPCSERIIHPCHYFDLAKQAFLKCLGLGSTSWKSSTRRGGRGD